MIEVALAAFQAMRQREDELQPAAPGRANAELTGRSSRTAPSLRHGCGYAQRELVRDPSASGA